MKRKFLSDTNMTQAEKKTETKAGKQTSGVTLKLPFLSWKGIKVPRLVANYGLIIIVSAVFMLIRPWAGSQLSRLEICEGLAAYADRTDSGGQKGGIAPVSWTVRQAARHFCAPATAGVPEEDVVAGEGGVAAGRTPAPVFSFSKDVHVVSITTDISAEDYPEPNSAGFLCGATSETAAIGGKLVAQICPDKTNNKSCIAFFEIADAQLEMFLAQQPGDGAEPVAIRADAATCHEEPIAKGDEP